MVDDFGVKYINKVDAGHLIMTLQNKFPIKMKLNGDYYLRMTLKWNYHKIHSEKNVRLSMPGYVKESTHRIQTSLHEATLIGLSILRSNLWQKSLIRRRH